VRPPKQEGNISSVFSSLAGEAPDTLPRRFSDLKKEIWKESLVESWRGVLKDLETSTEQVAAMGSEVSIGQNISKKYE